MPPSPWLYLNQPDPDREYLVLASYLPLVRARTIPRFLRYTVSIRSQLAQTTGLMGYSLRAALRTKEFWTLSAWIDEQALTNFVRTDPHRGVMTALAGDMGQTRFARWRLAGSVLPPDWGEALRRLAVQEGGQRG